MEPRNTQINPAASPAPNPSAAVDGIIGRNIALRRKAVGISRNNFAALLGVDAQKMKDVEAGASRLGPAAFLRAAQILGIRPSDIFRNVAGAFTADLFAIQIMTPPGPGADHAALRAQLERIMDKCDDILRLIDLIEAEAAP